MECPGRVSIEQCIRAIDQAAAEIASW